MDVTLSKATFGVLGVACGYEAHLPANDLATEDR
jgi:hypothetical protein